MEWFYAVGDKQMGPVNDEEFKKLAAEGTIRPDTLVWRAGMDNWKPYREVTAAAANTAAQPPLGMASGSGATTGATAAGSVVCRECGKIYPPEEVVKFGDAFVCGACKPTYVQRMREGVSGGGAAGTVSETELLARDYDVDIGEAISHSWEAFKRNAGLLIGASVVAYLVLIACNIIPIVSLILPWLLTGPLMGGLWQLYINSARGDELRFGDAFSGFGPRFGSLFGTYMVSSLLTGVCMIPAAIVAVIFLVVPIQAASQTGSPPDISMGAIIALIVTGLPAFLAIMYLSVAWMFALPLVSDKGMGFWAAMNLSRKMVNKHWWLTFALMFVCGLLSVVGLLACGVGMLVTAPVAFGAFGWHYQKLFGELAPDNA